MKTALYRQFDKENQLLYVGISLRYGRRIKEHYRGSAWFLDVTHIDLEWFDTREEALTAEYNAIKSEKPKCNKVHNSQQDGDETLRSEPREFQGMGAQVMRYLEKSNKMFLSKGEVANLVGVSNFYITNWIDEKKLKPIYPFLPASKREAFYIDDVIDCIRSIAEEAFAP